MQKMMFFDYRELELQDGFTRLPHATTQDAANPLLPADQPWEHSNMQMYGTVTQVPGGPWQLWYTTIAPPGNTRVAYAESDDGLTWRRPPLTLLPDNGKPTNLVLAGNPHGTAVMRDEADPNPQRRYKMLAGLDPSGAISGLTSPDGIHWKPISAYPVITTDPDCPIGLFRGHDGRFVALHRVRNTGRRVCRSESWDFRHWSSEAHMVLEPGPLDDCQTQFYGMGAALYGSFEIGTLWIYHTDTDDTGPWKMHGWQDTELTYARGGYATHRAAPLHAFINRGKPGDWHQGNIQASTQPVFLPHEIRYYFVGTEARHQPSWEESTKRAGIGMARLRPDGFISLEAGAQPARLISKRLALRTPGVFLNAVTRPGVWVRVAILDAENREVPGFGFADCQPFTGDATGAPVVWSGDPARILPDTPWRLSVTASQASLYSLWNLDPGETEPRYWQFKSFRVS